MVKLVPAFNFFVLEICNVILYIVQRLTRRAAPTIACPAGRVLGTFEAGGATVAFRGVFYATTPRFQVPQPYRPAGLWLNPSQTMTPNAQPWIIIMVSGPLLLSLGKMLAQFPWRRSIIGTHCPAQQLNIFAPKDHMERSKPLPVMVVVHGGAYFLGSGNQNVQDGAHAAAAMDCILVMVNYRLGALGFASGDGIPPNLGYQDILASLQWVKENIAYFNGDEDNITLNGESAGGHACMLLLANAAHLTADGQQLFHRVFAQSAPCARTVPLAVCEAATAQVAAALGWNPSSSSLLSAGQFLRSLHPSRNDRLVLEASKLTNEHMTALRGMCFMPFVDGTVVKCSIYDGLVQNAAAIRQVPVLMMHCRNEYTLFRDLHLARFGRDDDAALKQCVTSVVANFQHNAALASTLMTLYSNRAAPYIQTFGSKLPATTAFLGDCFLSVPPQHAAVLHSRHGGESHILRFDVEGSPFLGLKAGHFVDVPYVFQNTARCRLICGAAFKPAAQQELLRIVKRFVNGQPLPWPAVDVSAAKPIRNVQVLKNDPQDAPGVGQLTVVESDPFPEYFHTYESVH